MSSSKKKTFLKKIVSLLSLVRGYNVLVLVIAQYLASIFIFSPEKSLRLVLFDVHLHFLILSTICVVSAGYIINNFYDIKVDKINRPIKTGIDNYIRQETRLTLYFVLNFIGCLFGLLVSFRAAVFFAVYIFAIWIYSHKLKKYPFIGLLSATIITILPFFVVFIHFKNFSKIIFVHAIFLFLVLMVRELIKDLENLKGAIANNYNTFSVAYGEKYTKNVCLVLLVFTIVPVIFLFNYPGIDDMRYYFYFAGLMLVFVAFYLIKSYSVQEYRRLHNLLKILLLLGVFSLVFLDTSLLLEKVIGSLN
ncbi:geranylgeranylglycerol-phosphate geranylgeranyltransferase [Polaribacter sp.]|uniref:geranylgeranylglycerol-phosphate geranylgeranyltransferase n=1 Tax=Polaribacter sp. TaxID=1920175 RepID=UPI003F6A13D4